MEDRVFNYRLKDSFIKDRAYHPDTALSFMYVFEKFKSKEEEKGKDICHFDESELKEVIKSLKLPSLARVEQFISIISRYMWWASDYDIRNTVPPHINDELRSFVFVDNSKIISEEELRRVSNLCINAQDGICFALPFYGLFGHNLEEICNLAVKDCNTVAKTINVKGYFNRVIELPRWAADLLEEAINEDRYYINNGNSLSNKSFNKLSPNGYVLRTSGNPKFSPVDRSVVYQRVDKIKNFAGYPNIFPRSLRVSGQINFLKNNFTSPYPKEAYIELNKIFGIAEERWANTKRELNMILEER